VTPAFSRLRYAVNDAAMWGFGTDTPYRTSTTFGESEAPPLTPPRETHRVVEKERPLDVSPESPPPEPSSALPHTRLGATLT
jgi:hypothetical protein